MKHGRKVYGYFKTEKLAKKYIANAKKTERTYEGVEFNHVIVKRQRIKEGMKSWFAYRLIKKD